MLIKIMSGCSHMLVLGALKMMPTPLLAHGRRVCVGGRGGGGAP